MSIQDVQTLREVVNKLVPMIAGRGVRVTQMGSKAYVLHNGKTGKIERVNIPHIPDDADAGLILAIQGFIDHEIGHVLDTDWAAVAGGAKVGREIAADQKIDPAMAIKRVDNLANIVEDPFVERCMRNRFPGAAWNLDKLYDVFVKRTTQPALDAAKSDAERLSILFVPIIRSIAGQKYFTDFMDAGKHWDEPLVKALMDRISDDLKNEILTVKNSWDSLDVATQLYHILHPAPPPPPPPPPITPPVPPPSTPTPPPPEDDEETDEGEGVGSSDKPEDEDDKGSDGEEAESEPEAEPEAEDDGEAPAEGEPDEDEPLGEEDEPSSAKPEEDEAEDDEVDEPASETPEPTGDADSSDDGESEPEDEPAGEDEKEVSAGSSASEDEEEESEKEGKPAGDSESGEEKEDEKTAGEPAEPSPFCDTEIPESKDLAEAISDIITDEATRGMRDADYRIFTSEWDVIAPLEIGTNYDPSWLETLESKTRHMVSPMQKNIERMMAARSQVVKVPGYRSGRLHGGSLHRLRVNDDRVFRRVHENHSTATAVSLVVDNSGSMYGMKMQTAMAAAYALAQTLERLKINHEVIGFTTGDLSHEQRMEINAEEARIGVSFSRSEPIYMPIYKGFDERLTSETRSRFAVAFGNPNFASQNIDGECVDIACRRLLQQREPRRVMLVFSDGQPAGGRGDRTHLFSSLHAAVANTTKQGVEIVGIGIEDDSVRSFYPNFIVLQDVEDLPGTVMGELKRILLSPKK